MRKNIALLLFDDVEVLDFAGPGGVFGAADELLGGGHFHVYAMAPLPGTVRSRSGLKFVPDHTLEDSPAPTVLVVPGGAGVRALLGRPAFLEWVRLRARRAEIVLSVGLGALVLAKAGLLDGRRVTTHHENLEELAALAPTALVDASARFHANPGAGGAGHLLTAGGGAAGIDGALHAVRLLAGPNAAAATAHYLAHAPPA